MRGEDILPVARPHVREQYILGAAVNYNNRNWRGPWDCAEFTTWCTYQAYGILFGCDPQGTPGSAYTGAWRRDAEARGRKIPVADATRTPGAFLLRYPATGSGRIGHIAISVGDGSTLEAADARRGVIAGQVAGRRWDTGVLLPNVDYGPAAAPADAVADILRAEEFPDPDPRVTRLQLALKEKGFDPGAIDGMFGPMTEAAVAAFQATNGLLVDGEVGPQTMGALFGAAEGGNGAAGGVAEADVAPAPGGAPAGAVVAPTAPKNSTKYDDLKDEYLALYATLVPSPARSGDIRAAAGRVLAGKSRYEAVAAALGTIPWYVIGVINELESTSNFRTHLHNGDPLTAYTRHVPANRPQVGHGPPFTWEESAQDALTMKGYHSFTDWRLSRILHRLEPYNGYGSRRRGIFTPYLWSGSQHYVRGKYVRDGVWDPNAVSAQIGCAVILHNLASSGAIQLQMG